jgi:biotin carboxyl carrier protein
MPGKVLSIKATEGQPVSQGDTLMILEAMKMEHQIVAPRDGVIDTIKVEAGDQVGNGALLIELQAEQTNASEGAAS